MDRLLFFAILALAIFGVTFADSNKIIVFDPVQSNSKIHVIDEYATDLQCDNEEMINLSSMKLEKIPRNLINSSCVRSISLENNLLTNLPPNIFSGVPSLVCLNVENNRIPFKRLMNSGHEHLKTLIFRNQKYKEKNNLIRPSSFRSYNYYERSTTPLQYNDYYDDLSSANIVASFLSLEYLDLSRTVFDTHSLNFLETFPRLKHLYLNDCQNFKEIYSSNFFNNLSSTLKSLHLKRNNLTNIGFVLKDVKVEALFLDGNLFNVETIILPENLRVLSLSNCQLMNLDSLQLGKFPYLISLDLSVNSINEIPETTFNNTNMLQNLSLSRNQFYEFPHSENLNQLTSLSLDYNSIGEINHVIKFKSLRKLSLRGNRITKIGNDVFSSLFKLEEVDLSENQLTALPSNWMKTFQLRYLNLGSNQFLTIANMSLNNKWNPLELIIKNNALHNLTINELETWQKDCMIYIA